MILEPIHYINLNHSANNTTILPQFWITVVFNFSWEDCNTQENFETIVMQNFWGWTRCIMVYVKIVKGEKRSSWQKKMFLNLWHRQLGRWNLSLNNKSRTYVLLVSCPDTSGLVIGLTLLGGTCIFSSELCCFLKIILLPQK